MIKREEYLKKIRPLIGKNIIKIITGIRRCGKSTLLGQILDEIRDMGVSKDNILFMNFDSAKFQNINDKDSLNEYVSNFIKSNEKYYLFFDEIQNVEGFERSLSGFIVDYDVDIYISGSNSNLLSNELGTYLTGRYIEFNIYPFSFKEVVAINKKNNRKYDIEDLFNEYILYGGMPFIFSIEDTDNKKRYLKDVYNSIVFQDVLRRVNVRNIDLMDKIIRFVIMNLGCDFSSKNISNYLQTNLKGDFKIETIYKYLKYYENACFIHKVFKKDLIGKKLLKRHKKFYLTDQGFRQAIYGNNMRDIGQILENIVYMELLRRGYNVTTGEVNKKGVDFVARKEDKKIYIQVTYILAEKSTEDREFASLLKIRDNYPKYVLSTDKRKYDYEGIKKDTIINFLLSDW